MGEKQKQIDINDKNINYKNLKKFKENFDVEISSRRAILTQAEYDKLSFEEKHNGTLYFITDGVSGGGDASIVEKSEINGNICVNDEEIRVYDDTEIKEKIDNLNPIPEEVGTEINPVYIENGEFKQTTYELATDVPPGGTNRQFLRGDGKWASPEYNPEVVVIDVSFDEFLRMDTQSSSMTKEVKLDVNKNYQLYYNGFYSSTYYVDKSQCQVVITLEDKHEDKSNTNIKTVLNTTSSVQQTLDFSTKDYANPILKIKYTYKIVPTLSDTTSYTKNNVVVKGAGNNFDWGNPVHLRLGTAIQFDTTALGNWSRFNIAVCDSNYQNQEYFSHGKTDEAAKRGDFYVEYNATTKILTVCLYRVDITKKRHYIFYFDNTFNTCVACNFFQTYSESYLKTYPYSMSLKRDYISIAEQRIDELETKVNGITKEDIELGNVENKSSADIRGELTKSDVTTALGFTPPTNGFKKYSTTFTYTERETAAPIGSCTVPYSISDGFLIITSEYEQYLYLITCRSDINISAIKASSTTPSATRNGSNNTITILNIPYMGSMQGGLTVYSFC